MDLTRDLDVDIFEARVAQRVRVRLERDRARDATRPEIEPLLRVGCELLDRHHVGDGEPAVRPKDAVRLAKHRGLVRGEVDDAVGDHDIDGGVIEWELLDRALEEGRVRDTGLRLVALREVEHLVGHVDAERVTAGRHASRREKDVDARARTEVEHGLAGMQVGEERRVPAAEARGRVEPDARELVRGVSVAAGGRLVAAWVAVAAAGAALCHVERAVRVPRADALLHFVHATPPRPIDGSRWIMRIPIDGCQWVC